MSEPEFIHDYDFVHLSFDDNGEINAMHVDNLNDEEHPVTPLFIDKKPSERGAMYHVLFNRDIFIVQKDSFGRWRVVYSQMNPMRELSPEEPMALPIPLSEYVFVSIADTMYIGSLNNKYEVTRVKH